MWQLVAGLFLGWSLGTNDAANVFGTAVASRMVRFRTAAVLCSVFVVLGAVVAGREGMETYRELSPISLDMAFVVATAAGITVTLMSYLRLPVSTSQAVVGALVFSGIITNDLDLGSLAKVVACWIGTPIGAALVTMVLYFVIGKLMNLLHLSLFAYDRYMRLALVVAGSYASYALGANNVANVTGPFTGPGMLDPMTASIVGSTAIALGVFTYSRKVMMTVGRRLVKLDAYTAFVAILGEAVTVHVYAMVGVPVSTSQAIVGAVLGIGILKGVRTIDRSVLGRIAFGWTGTPVIAMGVAFLLWKALGLVGLI